MYIYHYKAFEFGNTEPAREGIMHLPPFTTRHDDRAWQYIKENGFLIDAYLTQDEPPEGFLYDLSATTDGYKSPHSHYAKCFGPDSPK